MSASKTESVKVGSVTVKLYSYSKNGSTYWQIADYSTGKRVLRSVASLEEGKKEAKRVAVAIGRGDIQAAGMTGRDRELLAAMMRSLEPLGVNPVTAVAEYAQAFKLLAGRPIVEAARYYSQKHPAGLVSKTVAQVADEFYEAKRAEGKSERYLGDCKSRHGRIADAFSMPISSVTAEQATLFLDGLKLGPRTRNNYLGAFQVLINFAIEKKYLPRDFDELDSLKKFEDDGGEIEILSPAELRGFLDATPAPLLPFLVIGAFAGLRSAELERLDWSDIDLAEGHLTVDAKKAKTKARRIVPLPSNLRQWLAPYKDHTGPVLTTTATHVVRAIKEAAPGLQWKANALRHSFVSYRLAQVKSADQVALEAGNSPQMVFQNYRQIVTEAQATEWFSVLPKPI